MSEFRTIFLSLNSEEDVKTLRVVLAKPERWLHLSGSLFVLGDQDLLVNSLNKLEDIAPYRLKLTNITTMADRSKQDWKMILCFGYTKNLLSTLDLPIGSNRNDEKSIYKCLIKASQEMPLTVACNGALMSTLKQACGELCCKLQQLVINQ